MRALLYIFLVALVLWASATWENARAPVVVTTAPVEEAVPAGEQEVVQESEIVVEVAEEAPLPSKNVPVGASNLPTPPPEPVQVAYDEAYVEQLELAVHNRINEERVREGLDTLQYDNVLAQVAAFHSTDMAKNDYFAHEDENGCDSACRVTAAGYKWRAVGENLFLLKREYHFSADGASAVVVAGWMGSEGHRKNMFEPDFTHEGIGVVILGDSIYVTEVLARPR